MFHPDEATSEGPARRQPVEVTYGWVGCMGRARCYIFSDPEAAALMRVPTGRTIGRTVVPKRTRDRILDTSVTADDIKTALLAVDGMDPAERNDFTSCTIAVMSAFGLLRNPGSGKTGPMTDDTMKRIGKVTATQIRLEALTEIVSDPKFKAWSIDASNGRDGYILMREEVLKAVAETPLRESKRGKSSYFNREEFFEKLLSVSPNAGSS